MLYSVQTIGNSLIKETFIVITSLKRAWYSDMKELVCKCGGNLQKKDNYWICDSCRTKYISDRDDDGNVFYYQPIEKMSIECGQVAAKATAIPVNTVIAKEIKINDNAEVEVLKDSLDLTIREMVNNVKSYLSAGAFEQAQNSINQIFAKTNLCAEAYWYTLWCEKKISSEKEVAQKFSAFTKADSIRLNNALENSSPEFARSVIDLLFNSAYGSDESCKQIFSTIIPFTYDTNVYSSNIQSEKIKYAFSQVIDYAYSSSFEYLLNTLKIDEVEDYINYLTRFAGGHKCTNAYAQICYRKVLSVDVGNNQIRQQLIEKEIQADTPYNIISKDFDELVKYSGNVDNEVTYFIDFLNTEPNTTTNKSNFMMYILGFHSNSPDGLKDRLLKYASVLLKSKQFDIAKNYYYLVLSADKRNADAYWGLCLARIEAKDENSVIYCSNSIMGCIEFNKYLSLVDETRKKQCITLGKKQNSVKAGKKKAIIIGIVAVIAIFIIVLISSIVNTLKYSPNNIKLMVSEKQEDLLSITIENKSILNISDISGVIRAYDYNGDLIMECDAYFVTDDFSPGSSATHELEIRGDIGIFRATPLDEMSISFEVKFVMFEGRKSKNYDVKEKFIQKYDADVVKKKRKEMIGVIDEAMAALDNIDFNANTWEDKLIEAIAIMDDDWEYIVSHEELMEHLYQYAQNFYREGTTDSCTKAFQIFYLLYTYEYKDCYDMTMKCYEVISQNQGG